MNLLLRQALRRLCSDSDWNYAIFWKLKNFAPVVLAWEDAYCDDDADVGVNNNNNNNRTMRNSKNDPLSLLRSSIGRLSSHAYYVGEGVVGKVGWTGLHEWISAEESWPPPRLQFDAIDGWQAQLSAGVRTILVVGVLPLGVVQLGSFSKVVEDLEVVSNIRKTFLVLEDDDPYYCYYHHYGTPRKSMFEVPCSGNVRGSASAWTTQSDGGGHFTVLPETDNNGIKAEESSEEIDFEKRGRDGTREFTMEAAAAASDLPSDPHYYSEVDGIGGCEWGGIESVISYEDPRGRDGGGDHLLEAVVASAVGKFPKETPFCGVAADEVSMPDDVSVCDVSAVSDGRCCEPPVRTRKRSRAGENSRPRPRDRQLIQDRIKELREIIPSGAKCSIDSLLERTIKHVLFLQSVTEHADTIKECSMRSSCREAGPATAPEHGSSWVMEVGGRMVVCPIIVENLSDAGQFLVELLCEDCTQFLELAEAVRNVGMTIMKGRAEVRGDGAWICFILEGPKERSMHRMDILFSLFPLLQPKPAC